MYESWGWVAPWNGVPTKAMGARWPVIEPKAREDAGRAGDRHGDLLHRAGQGHGLPGFGDGAITDTEGNAYALNGPEDWYLRAGANIAWLGKDPVADATEEDIMLSGVRALRRCWRRR